MVYKDLWVVSFPRCTAGPNIVGSCCIRLHTTANMHATTPNIVVATMLGVVASVCTQPKDDWHRNHIFIIAAFSSMGGMEHRPCTRWYGIFQHANTSNKTRPKGSGAYLGNNKRSLGMFITSAEREVKNSRGSGLYQSWHFWDKIRHAKSVGFRFYLAIWRSESRISSRYLEITSISLIYSLTYSRKKELVFWLSLGLNHLTCVTRQIRGDSKLRD